ncbi:hypothetical protein ACPCG0_01200 [Propionibacteriaceae bacterium Y1923]
MSIVQRHPGLRWLVPIVALALVFTIPAVSQRMASADPGLPPRTAEQLLTDLAEAKPVPLSGTVQQNMNLGLPTLPQVGPTEDDTSTLGLLTGNHTWRIWTNAADSARVAKVNGSEELTLVHNPTETWLWNSSTREAARKTHDPADAKGKPDQTPTVPSPSELAQQVLAELDPTTEVTTDTATTVAGRAAYQLVLTPKQADTTIAHVRLAIDAQYKLPLRLVITAKGVTTPAVQVGFTSISFEAPSAEVFTFTPPADSTVYDPDNPPTDEPGEEPGEVPGEEPGAVPNPEDITREVVGTGWTQVLLMTGLGDLTASDDPAVTELLGQYPVISGDWGRGRLVRTTLVNAVVTDDGRVAVGAVTPELLYAALR